jgi:hypothetical protein
MAGGCRLTTRRHAAGAEATVACGGAAPRRPATHGNGAARPRGPRMVRLPSRRAAPPGSGFFSASRSSGRRGLQCSYHCCCATCEWSRSARRPPHDRYATNSSCARGAERTTGLHGVVVLAHLLTPSCPSGTAGWRPERQPASHAGPQILFISMALVADAVMALPLGWCRCSSSSVSFPNF